MNFNKHSKPLKVNTPFLAPSKQYWIPGLSQLIEQNPHWFGWFYLP